MSANSAIEITPANKLSGTVEIPGSKSYTNRALLVASLAQGKSRLLRPLHSDDTRYMAAALRQLGVRVSEEENGQACRIEGCAGRLGPARETLYVGNAGTAMRFLTAALCLGQGEYRIDGNERMRQRPLQDLVDALRQLGCGVESEAGNGCPPLRVMGGGIAGGHCRMKGDKSSQYFSALMMASAWARNDVTIEVDGELVSKPYADMTVELMGSFGVSVTNEDYRRFVVPAGPGYQGREYLIEPDATNASYYWAAAAIGGGPVRVLGLSLASVQGDVGFVRILEQMGCAISHGKDWIEVRGGQLRGGEFELGDMPDTAQTLSVVALFAEGTTTLHQLGTLRIKETDRIAAVANELRKLGALVKEGPDFLSITPGPYRAAQIETYNDHRMAMSFALAGARIPGVAILNPSCVTKTYPSYFEDMKRIGLDHRPIS